MSNKFKIKNIWTPEVSREEYAKTLSEWDNALSSIENGNLADNNEIIFKSNIYNYSINTWTIVENFEPMKKQFTSGGIYQLLIYFNGVYWYYFSLVKLTQSKQSSPVDGDNTICDFSFYDNNKQLHFGKINYYKNKIRIKFDGEIRNVQLYIYPLRIKIK